MTGVLCALRWWARFAAWCSSVGDLAFGVSGVWMYCNGGMGFVGSWAVLGGRLGLKGRVDGGDVGCGMGGCVE